MTIDFYVKLRRFDAAAGTRQPLRILTARYQAPATSNNGPIFGQPAICGLHPMRSGFFEELWAHGIHNRMDR